MIRSSFLSASQKVFDQIAKVTRGITATNLPRAVLFAGPAGVGKTSMAKIIARETQIPLVCIAVENILSKYYGESAQILPIYLMLLHRTKELFIYR